MATSDELYELMIQHDKIHNEGGYGYNPYRAKYEEACRVENEARIQAMVDDAENIRARWNAAVKKYTDSQGRLPTKDLKKVEKEAGVTLNDIQILKGRLGK